MSKMILYVVGGVFVVVGLLGFVNDPVLGIFEVDPVHNLIHLVTGAALLFAAMKGGSMGAMLVKIFAVVYALVAVAGFALPGDTLLGLIEVNLADHVLHVAVAAVLIWVGFFAMKGGDMMHTDMGGGQQPPQPNPSQGGGQPTV